MKSKLFFTRGDIFEGIFYKYAMKEGIMHVLQSDGSYKRYQQKYDAERDAEAKCLVKNQVPLENTPLD